ncbi:MAG: mechanosensitive ion channel family protein [Gammaproteobacteria bacterium]|nr:mechanosensitive ion channel family protein [Gammaproteobacteria bacterium]
MDTIRSEFKQFLLPWLEQYMPGAGSLFFDGLVLLWIGIVAIVLHFFLCYFVRRNLAFWLSKTSRNWDLSIDTNSFFGRASFILQGAVVQIQAKLWFDDTSSLLHIIQTISDQWIILFALLTLFSVLDITQNLADKRTSQNHFPIKGLLQTVKLIASVLTALLAISLLMGKSPLILLSGLGALSAVLLLVFKDPIMGLVAGIQLSANNMLSVGDWLEMPKYGADGDVIDIALTTVKVRNWDKTITTIPTYALISDSFKNWRGMSESGGRRIKRSVLIQASSVRFLDDELLARLTKADLLGQYISERLELIERENTTRNTDMSIDLNGRRLTNIGTFRQYLKTYLCENPNIHQEMTLMVRQLESSTEGIPIEIYAFTNTTSWEEYEAIQADIFDHVFAILPAFDLCAHESPTGYDIRGLTLPEKHTL